MEDISEKTEKVAWILKRILDVAFALVAVVLLSPLLLAIAVIIKLVSSGPVLFRQERAGRAGRVFVLYKFRTMHADAEAFGRSPSAGDDSRLIRFGKFFREYSLDELPQLFNVLKGDMSIVGPRPLYASQVRQLNDYHKQRLKVRPGITGMSQLYGRSELLNEKMLDMEVKYVCTQSFWIDLKLMLLTPVMVLKRHGVYEK
jgi:lipopolysaccharide/colanic/teichoic acid biosynthesis glycosyltransferase